MPLSPRPLALVTGASRGIGLELARQAARSGHDLVVCAEDEAVHEAATGLRALGVDVLPVVSDLSTADGVEHLWAAVVATGRPLAVAALNAGVGRGESFVDQPLADVLHLVDLDVRGTTHLAHRVLQPMAARGSGRVLLTSSVAAAHPGAYQAAYNASKSFVQSLAEALHEELRGTGVTVTALMPGPTRTDVFRRAQMDGTLVARGPLDDPADVARRGWEALLRGRRKVAAASPRSRLMVAAGALLPDGAKAWAHGVAARPRG